MDLFAYADHTEPESPPLSGSRSPTPTPSPRTFKDLALRVYKDVWSEFYDWEHTYCTDTLRETVRTTRLRAPERLIQRAARKAVARLRSAPARSSPQGDDLQALVTQYHTDHGRTAATRSTLALPVIPLDPLDPHPLYESCAPASRSIAMDSASEDTLSFIPYADDDAFPAHAYQAKFADLEWEKPFDPDVEIIQMEAVRRLHAVHEIDIPDIEGTNVFKELRGTHNVGLLWDVHQRDLLPGVFRTHEDRDQLPSYTPDVDDLRQRLVSTLRVFCPSINCLHAMCPTHGTKHASSYIPSGKPRMTGQEMILSEGAPCGPDCFRHVQDFDTFMETLAPSSSRYHTSLDTLETVLGIAPDLFPCQLAVICLRPCNQIFVQRRQLFPDDTIIYGDVENYGRYRKRKPQFNDTKSVLSHELPAACAHPGPCTTNNCPCFTKKMHCSLICRCGVKCERQWPPCNCLHGRCRTDTCPCAVQARECIPGICINCDAGPIGRPGHNGRPCTNTNIQQLDYKAVEIKCGKYGLGAFARQDMPSGTFLGSYVGHMLSRDRADPMGDLAKHNARNYMFDVSDDTADPMPIFDAAYLGNATRFLNHGSVREDDPEVDNVDAHPKLVIGEYQIGFFTKARVQAGEELFLDYGQNYWK